MGQTRQAVRNGELRPAVLNGGTVQLTIKSLIPRTNDNRCSGQVISRDTLLTAAHCFYNHDYYRNGWQEAVPAEVWVRHQNPDGSWENLSNNKENATVYVREDYVTLRNADDPHHYGVDIAVVRLGRNWMNAQSSDATALPRYHTDPQPNWAILYGHGYHTDTLVDGDLRSGVFRNLSWFNSSAHDYYRRVLSMYHASDAQSCSGDSGGPWKLPSMYYSGVQYGVHADGYGSPNCAEYGAYAAQVAHHDDWIEQKVKTGAGSCYRETLPIQPDSASWNIQQVRVKVCW